MEESRDLSYRPSTSRYSCSSQQWQWQACYQLISVLLLLISSCCDSARILSVSFFSARSHGIAFAPLLERLVQHGHQLTIISPEEYPASFSQLTVSDSDDPGGLGGRETATTTTVRQIIGKKMEDFSTIDFIQSRLDSNYFAEPKFFATIVEPLCRSYLEMPELKQLLKDHQNGTHQFDLIIASAMMNECSLGYISQFNNTPFILTVPLSPLATTAAIFGTPSPSSFVPVPVFSSLTHSMSLVQRVQNMILGTVIPLSFHLVLYPKVEVVYRSILGSHVPSVNAIQSEASLLLMNSHFSLTYPRPLMEGMIDVGGLHCRPGKHLPKDLQNFLDNSGPDGFIYMSFGSVIKSTSLPENYRRVFLAVFSQLKQRILWKWENETIIEELPSNVKLSPWISQQDVLAHPKIKAFITHGGLLSTQEAVYHAVPLVGVPIFADQDWNMAQSENAGFAITLDFNTLTEDALLDAINHIIKKTKYKENVQKLSAIFKDRPVNPLDSAVYWTEYVLRHKGAPHLRSPARNLSWIQYYSFDVVLILFVCSFCSFYIMYKISAFVVRLVKCRLVIVFRNDKQKVFRNNNKKGN